ncbi:MAG: hypothetical protein VXZ96_01815 [Myxococcota bacterium]|nr:hypothetical protein [Myxococcota bacterium]
MNVLEIFSSQMGLTLWTTGVSAALFFASSLCIYMLPWQDKALRHTHGAIQDAFSPLKGSSLNSKPDPQLLQST